MPRPRTTENVSAFQEVTRLRLAALDPPVDLDKLVIEGRTALTPQSWRNIADQINDLLDLDPPIAHPTVKSWYLEKLDAMGVPREGPGPGPRRATESA